MRSTKGTKVDTCGRHVPELKDQYLKTWREAADHPRNLAITNSMSLIWHISSHLLYSSLQMTRSGMAWNNLINYNFTMTHGWCRELWIYLDFTFDSHVFLSSFFLLLFLFHHTCQAFASFSFFTLDLEFFLQDFFAYHNKINQKFRIE